MLLFSLICLGALVQWLPLYLRGSRSVSSVFQPVTDPSYPSWSSSSFDPSLPASSVLHKGDTANSHRVTKTCSETGTSPTPMTSPTATTSKVLQEETSQHSSLESTGLPDSTRSNSKQEEIENEKTSISEKHKILGLTAMAFVIILAYRVHRSELQDHLSLAQKEGMGLGMGMGRVGFSEQVERMDRASIPTFSATETQDEVESEAG